MDCFGTCFTHAQTSDVKPRCKHPRSPLQRWRLQAPFKPPSSPLEAPFKPPWSPSKPPSPSKGFKPPSSPLEAPFKPPSSVLKPSEGEAPFKPPSSPLEAPFKKLPSPSEGFKPPSSPLEAPLKPPSSPLEAFRRWSPLQAPFKPPWSPLEAPFKPPWSLPKVKPPSTFRPSSPPPRPQTLQAPLKGACEGGTSEPAPSWLHSCNLATPPTTSSCALPGHDLTANGPSAPLATQEGGGLHHLTVSHVL